MTLTNELALQESPQGSMYEVVEIIRIEELSDVCEWLFFRLEPMGEAADSWLMVKIVDQAVDVRVYSPNADFETGNREDLIDNDQMWAFQEPDDPDDFELSELQYTKHVGWDFVDGDDEIHVDYNIKGQGEMQGKVQIDPPKSGQSELVATIVEYESGDDTTSPEMLMLEIGSYEIDEGGLIRMFFGNSIRTTEVDVLAITAA